MNSKFGVSLKKATVCLLLLLFASFLSVLPISNSQVEEPKSGNITFQPNIIPQLILTPRTGRNNESFRFSWLNNTFDLELFFNATYERRDVNETRLFSLKDFEDDFNVTVEYVVNRNESMVRFGWLVENVEDVSDYVHNAWFKIEDTQPFDYDEIELEEIEVFDDFETGESLEEPYNITRFHLPDNLVLSFEDLYHKGFIVGHQNKTSTSVKGFSGKSSWNLDPITFSGDIITVVGETGAGDTEANAYDFEDLYNADLAGTYELEPSKNYSIADCYVPIYLDNQPRPADWGGIRLIFNVSAVQGNIQLIRTSGKLADKEDTSDYLDDRGTGATGYLYTQRAFRSVNYFYLEMDADEWIVFNIIQLRWGVVWKTGTTQFMFDARIVIGDGSTTTWFVDTSKQITFTSIAFTANWQYAIDVRRYGYVRFGTLLDEATKATKDGVSFVINHEAYRPIYLFGTASDWNTHDRQLYVYSSSATNIGDKANRFLGNFRGGDHRFWHIITSQMGLVPNKYPSSGGNTNIYDVYVTEAGFIVYVGIGLTIDRVYVTDALDTVWTQQAATFTINNVISRRATRSLFYGSTNWQGPAYLINFDVDSWTFAWALDATGKVYRQYEFDLTVTYPNNTAYENANVTITYEGQGGGQVGSWLTDSNGQIPTQTLSRSFYNQTGGNTEYAYYPFNITITANGMDTYTKKWTPTEKTTWEIALTPTATAPSVSTTTYMLLGAILFSPIMLAIALSRRNKAKH